MRAGVDRVSTKESFAAGSAALQMQPTWTDYSTVPEVDTNTKALRLALRDLGLGDLSGVFLAAFDTGTISLTTSALSNSCFGVGLNTATGRLVALKRFSAGLELTSGTGITAGISRLKLLRGSNMLTLPGGTDVSPTPAGRVPLVFDQYPPTFRLQLAGAAALTVSSATRDTNYFAMIVAGCQAAATQTVIPFQTLYEWLPGETPQLFHSNEFFELYVDHPAAGTSQVLEMSFLVEWYEFNPQAPVFP